MQEGTNTKKIVLAIVVILFVAFLLYFFLFRDTEPEMTFDEFGNPVAAQVVGKDLIDLLAELQSVTLNAAIFQSPLFLNLIDRGIELRAEPIGRPNPFANLPGGAPRPSNP